MEYPPTPTKLVGAVGISVLPVATGLVKSPDGLFGSNGVVVSSFARPVSISSRKVIARSLASPLRPSLISRASDTLSR